MKTNNLKYALPKLLCTGEKAKTGKGGGTLRERGDGMFLRKNLNALGDI